MQHVAWRHRDAVAMGAAAVAAAVAAAATTRFEFITSVGTFARRITTGTELNNLDCENIYEAKTKCEQVVNSRWRGGRGRQAGNAAPPASEQAM